MRNSLGSPSRVWYSYCVATKTITLSEDAYRRWEERARRHGRTVSEEIETAAPAPNGGPSAPAQEQAVDPDKNPNRWLLDFADSLEEPAKNPNQGWLDLADSFKDVEWKPGPQFGSPEWKDMYARDLYRDTFNLEPDW